MHNTDMKAGERRQKADSRKDVRFAFFGTDPLAEAVLNELEKVGFIPSLVVAGPDKLTRAKKVEFPSEKKWAVAHNIRVVQPDKIDDEFLSLLRSASCELFIVASYGKILSQKLLDIPVRGTLNIHPSLLPRLRGPSPMRSAILTDERETGVTIMLMDNKMDHGPILAQKKVPISPWPPRGRDLDALLAHEGGRLLATMLPEWLAGTIEAREQNHDLATYTQFMKKEDAFLDLQNGDAYQNLLKIRAYESWPVAYAIFEKKGKRIRVQLLDAHIEGAALKIDRVKPEGKPEMSYDDFLRGMS